MSDKIISPCISICKTDPLTGYCYGCARTEEEKKMDEKIEYWKNKGSDKLYMNSFSRKKWSQF